MVRTGNLEQLVWLANHVLANNKVHLLTVDFISQLQVMANHGYCARIFRVNNPIQKIHQPKGETLWYAMAKFERSPILLRALPHSSEHWPGQICASKGLKRAFSESHVKKQDRGTLNVNPVTSPQQWKAWLILLWLGHVTLWLKGGNPRLNKKPQTIWSPPHDNSKNGLDAAIASCRGAIAMPTFDRPPPRIGLA